jgi:histidine triad (HIT) family protein
MRSWKLLALVLAAFAAGEADPVGWLYWKAAQVRLPHMKAESLAGASPFETIPPNRWIAQSQHAFAIGDREPQAPTHVLVVSKERVPSLLDARPEVLSDMLGLAADVARARGIADAGFRVVVNTNPEGAQTVYHLHMHVLGGRQMRWPPG